MSRVRFTSPIGLAGALALHAGLLAVLFGAQPPAPAAEQRRPPVTVKLVQRTPPPQPAPAPAPAPEPAATPEPPPVRTAPTPPARPKRLVARVAKRELQPRPLPEPEPPAAPTAEPPRRPEPPRPSSAPRPARKFSVSMEATVPGGGVAVPVSGSASAWAFGAPDGAPEAPRIPGGAPSGDPDARGPATDSKPLSVSEVNRLPRLIRQPSAQQMRAAYPDQARREGKEANVSLKILVSAGGKVVRVRIVRPGGDGFDEVARQLVQQFQFEPGESGGQPVAVWIPWTYKFRLEG